MKYAWLFALVLACHDTPSVPTESPPTILTKRIDQLVPADRDRELRLSGTVAAPFEVAGSGTERTITFSLVQDNATMRVVATGVLPDRFREHVTASVVGRWVGDHFRAREVFVSAPEFPEPKATSP